MGKYNEKTVNEICQFLEDGLPQKDAAVLSGISEKTFYRWMEKHDSFDSKVEASITRYKEKLIKIVNVHSVKDGKLALEILARRWPDEFGTKQKVELAFNPQEEMKKIDERIKERWPEIEDTTNKLPPPTSETTAGNPSS